MTDRLESNLKPGAFIARGHFGDVHLGTDDIHGEVAIKIFRQAPGESTTDWQTRRSVLLSEGQKLKQGTHRNVVDVYHLVQSKTGDEILLAMEYCSGGSLQKKFDHGPMTLRSVRDHATQITFGLQALHDRKMLHRDIKPGNLLVDSSGVTKLGDFGLVTDDLILGYGSAVGYLDHLPPEVHQGGPTSVRSDIWAMGMTIYRLLHGSTWYQKSAPPQVIVPAGGYADALRWLPHIPKPWRRVVRKALNDDPDYRFQNAGGLITALASLPVEPDWRCTVTASEVDWRRKTPDRRIFVKWIEHSVRRHEWKAWSEPINSGRRRSLGGSGGLVGFREADRILQAFFATHV